MVLSEHVAITYILSWVSGNLGVRLDELLHLSVDFVADSSELGEDFFVSTGEGVGIVEADVETLANASGEGGAGLFGISANGDDEVPGLVDEAFYGFGVGDAEVDADFAHNDLGQRMHFLGGVDAGGTDGLFRRKGFEPAFCHLAAASVAGAENENFHGIIF